MVGPRRPFFSGLGAAGALGLNLWALAFVIPMAFSNARSTLWTIAPLAPICLAWGVRRRSPPALLLGVPVAALMPLALPELEARRYQAGFVVVAASLVAYVIAALMALEAPPGPPRIGDPIQPIARWIRRLRIYRGFAVAALVLPVLLLYAIDLHPTTVAALSVSFAGDAERARALMTCAATLLFALAFAAWFARPLVGHLDHDLVVRVTVEKSRIVARRGRLSATFYVAVVCALGLMALVVALGAGGR